MTIPEIMDELKKACIIIGVASLAGIVFNLMRPEPLAWVRETMDITPFVELTWKEFEKAQAEGAGFVDVRSPQAFAVGHWPSAVNIPTLRTETYLARIFAELPAQGRIILYGIDAHDRNITKVADFLITSGYQPFQLGLFRPGWEMLRSKLPATAEAGRKE